MPSLSLLSYVSRPDLINFPTVLHLCLIDSKNVLEFTTIIILLTAMRQHRKPDIILLIYQKNANIHLRWNFTLDEMLLHATVCCALTLFCNTLTFAFTRTHSQVSLAGIVNCTWLQMLSLHCVKVNADLVLISSKYWLPELHKIDFPFCLRRPRRRSH